jgi:hypothetical protein
MATSFFAVTWSRRRLLYGDDDGRAPPDPAVAGPVAGPGAGFDRSNADDLSPYVVVAR